MQIICSLASVNAPKAPAWRPASALQLTLNVFDCRCIRSSNGDLASENHVQHVKECVRWNAHQLCQHGQPPEANLKIAICSGNPPARLEHSEVNENRGDRLGRTLRCRLFVTCQGHCPNS